MFPHIKPRPSDDGVKAYTICPSVVPTDMNIGEAGVEDREEAVRIFAKMARERNYGTRALVKEEVGEAMMHSMKQASKSWLLLTGKVAFSDALGTWKSATVRDCHSNHTNLL